MPTQPAQTTQTTDELPQNREESRKRFFEE
jgi:hypothetical protein